LRVLAKLCKRQIAIFFLPQVPQKIKKPIDYRNLSNSTLSPETLLAMRRAQKFIEVLKELNGIDFYNKKYEWIVDFKNQYINLPLSRSSIINWVRDKLQYSIETQFSDKSIELSYSNWRDAFEEKLGIHIFQFNMPANETQGFCYSHTFPYCIVVNGRYSVASKIFTLFHELGHLLRKQSGMCLPDSVTEGNTLEFEYNSFAGATLLPENFVVPLYNQEEIFSHARKLKVSSEVYLRRQKSLGLIDNDTFFSLLEDIRKAIKPPRKRFARSSPMQKSMNSRGHNLFYTVVDAVRQNRISYNQASDILGVKINHLITA